MWQETQLLVAAMRSRPPLWWQAVQVCICGSRTSVVRVLVMTWLWQSTQVMLRWESWSKTLAVNQRRPSGVGWGIADCGLRIADWEVGVAVAVAAAGAVAGTADCPLPTADCCLGWAPAV